MKKFQDILPIIRPEVTITPKNNVSFDIKVNEVPWMYSDLRVGKRVTWGIYDAPDWALTDCEISNTLGKAKIHGISCVDIEIKEYEKYNSNEPNRIYHLYIHDDDELIQYVAKSEKTNGVFEMISLYDDEFIKNYICDFYRNIKDNGFAVYESDDLNKIHFESEDDSLLIGAGVFDVQIGENTFECLRVIDRWEKSPRIVVENYINRDGRSILFRRYNNPVWKYSRYKQRWDEKLPDTNRLFINSEVYIHWYDCISDIVFN